MNVVWEDVWDSVDTHFQVLAATLKTCNPQLWWSSLHSENRVFPFRAYATFSREGIPGDEDVVVSLTFKSNGARLAFSSDISRGDGSILADGPTRSLPLSTHTGAVREWIIDSATCGLRFVDENTALLRKELCITST